MQTCCDRGPGQRLDGLHGVRAVRRGGQRLERRQVDLHRPRRSSRVGPRLQRAPGVAAPLRLEELAASRSSLGKSEVVAPSSAPMFVIVARSGTERVRDAGAEVLEDLARRRP